jgi:peptidoglycan hydrolase CwlO-like protein
VGDDRQIVPAEVIYVVAESFMLNDYPTKGAVMTFHVGNEVKNPKIVKQYGSYLKRTVKEVEGEDADDILDSFADEKIEKLTEENAGFKEKVKALDESAKTLTKENEKLTAELEKANKEIEHLKKKK